MEKKMEATGIIGIVQGLRTLAGRGEMCRVGA